jgi:hypothetical protein
MDSEAYPFNDSLCTWLHCRGFDPADIADPVQFDALVHTVVADVSIVLAQRLFAAAAAWQLPVDTATAGDTIPLQRWATANYLNGDLVWKPFQDDALLDAVNGGGYTAAVPNVTFHVTEPPAADLADAAAQNHADADAVTHANADDAGDADDTDTDDDDDDDDYDDDSDFEFALQHADAVVSVPAVMQVVRGDATFRAIERVWRHHIPVVVRDIKALLHRAVAEFLERTVTFALPAERGVLRRSAEVTRLLYGCWVEDVSRSGRARTRTWSGYSSLALPVHDASRARGILRLILLHVAETASGMGGHVTPLLASLNAPAASAAELLCSCLAVVYRDAPPVASWVMSRCDPVLITMVATVLHCTASAAVKYVLTDRRYAPFVESDVKAVRTGVVHVHHVMENVLAARSQGTFALLKPKHGLPAPLRVPVSDTARFAWLRVRACLKQAVQLAYRGGVDAPLDVAAFRRLCVQCDADPSPRYHISRACFLLSAALAASGAVPRNVLAAMEATMLRPMDIDAEGSLVGLGGPLDPAVPSVMPFVRAVAREANTEADPACCSVPAYRVGVNTFLPSREDCSWHWWTTWADADGGMPTDGPSQARVLQAVFDTAPLWPPSHTANEQVLPRPVAAPHAAAAVLGWGRYGTLPSWPILLQGLCHDTTTYSTPSVSILPAFALAWQAARAVRAACAEAYSSSSGEKVTASESVQPGGCVCCVCAGPYRPAAPGIGCPAHTTCLACLTEQLEVRAVGYLRGGEGAAGADTPHADPFRCLWAGCATPVITTAATLNAVVAPELAAVLLAAAVKRRDRGRDREHDTDTASDTALLSPSPSSPPTCCHCDAAHGCTWSCELGRHAHCARQHGAVYVCGDCGGATCTQCSAPAHPGAPCLGRLHPTQTPQEVLSAAKIQMCPQCAAPTVKNLACNHITCEQCGDHWCWACGQQLSRNDITAHYRSVSPRCEAYSSATELSRMRTSITEWVRDGSVAVAVAAAALDMLDGAYMQTEDDL